MSATISTYSGSPTPNGTLATVAILGGSPVAPNTTIQESFGHDADEVETGSTVFNFTGWNQIIFKTGSPLTVSSYTIWFGEDYQTGNRAVRRFQILAATDSTMKDLTIVDDVTLEIPYFSNYSSDHVKVINTVTPITAQYWILAVQGIDYSMNTFGPRICGFQFNN